MAIGGNGKDTLAGTSAVDVHDGGNGNDLLFGAGGDDILNGGNGKDVLVGGIGADTMTGGNGNDVFAWAFDDLLDDSASALADGWQAANLRGDGAAAAALAYQDEGADDGAVVFSGSTASPSYKADYVVALPTVAGDTDGYAELSALTEIGFDWYRDASSAAADHFAPALRLAYWDAGGDGQFGTLAAPGDDKFGYLIWERVYNTPGAAPEDMWVSEDLTDDHFWMREFGPGNTVETFNRTLADWAAGATGGVNQTHVLDATTRILGIEVGIGSGWTGSFAGAADNVHVAFGTTSFDWDFNADPVVDVITDFDSRNDKLDLSELLQGYQAGVSVLSDFVQATTVGADTTVLVDADGTGVAYDFRPFVVLEDATINLATDLVL